MQPYYDINEEESTQNLKPLLSIWIKPKRTFEYLINLDYLKLCNKLDITLAFISLSLILQSMPQDIEKTLDLGFGYLMVIGIISLVFGFLFLKYVYAYFLLLLSKIFQGKADITRIRIALTYALVPLLINLIISVGLIISSIVTKNVELLSYQNPITYYVLTIISLRILVIGLGYFNKYSYGYSLMTVLIPVGIIQLVMYYFMR
jgi:hypothetical protein